MYTFDSREDYKNFALKIVQNLEFIGEHEYLVKELNNWNTTCFTTSSEFLGDLVLILKKVVTIDALDKSLNENISWCISEIYRIARFM
jgi:hypothetical protein